MHKYFNNHLSRLGLLLALAPSLQAHEFWFAPVASVQTVGSNATLRLEVGEFFNGEPAGFSIPTTKALRHYTAKSEEDLRPFLPAQQRVAEVALALQTPGIHLLAYDSTPMRLTLSADKFHAYLHDEGLDFVKAQREQAGTAEQPGRERYRRHIKTLIAVGAQSKTAQAQDLTWGQRTGQRLEMMPVRNPLSLAAGDVLPVRVVFDEKPLAGALVKAWHKHKDQLVMIRATTSAQGMVEFNLPYAGDWMVSVVHMIPAIGHGEVGAEEVDWDSFWGNLSFHMPGKRRPKK